MVTLQRNKMTRGKWGSSSAAGGDIHLLAAANHVLRPASSARQWRRLDRRAQARRAASLLDIVVSLPMKQF